MIRPKQTDRTFAQYSSIRFTSSKNGTGHRPRGQVPAPIRRTLAETRPDRVPQQPSDPHAGVASVGGRPAARRRRAGRGRGQRLGPLAHGIPRTNRGRPSRRAPTQTAASRSRRTARTSYQQIGTAARRRRLKNGLSAYLCRIAQSPPGITRVTLGTTIQRPKTGYRLVGPGSRIKSPFCGPLRVAGTQCFRGKSHLSGWRWLP